MAHAMVQLVTALVRRMRCWWILILAEYLAAARGTLAMELSGQTRSHVAAAVTPTTTVKGGKRLILTGAVATSSHTVPGSLANWTTTLIHLRACMEVKKAQLIKDTLCCLVIIISICYLINLGYSWIFLQDFPRCTLKLWFGESFYFLVFICFNLSVLCVIVRWVQEGLFPLLL